MIIARMSFLACLVMVGSLVGSALAQDASPIKGEDRVALKMIRKIRAGGSPDAVREIMLRWFRSTDIDGGGVSESDYLLRDRMNAAQRRAALISQMLKKDLDGDGAATRAELEAFHGETARKPIRSQGVELVPTAEQVVQTLAKLVDDDLKIDQDNDGTVNFAEILAAAEDNVARRGSSRHRNDGPVHPSLDRDGDGVVSEREFVETVDRVLGGIDGNGDAEFSEAEVAAFSQGISGIGRVVAEEERARKLEAKNRELAESCGFPRAPDGAEVVMLAVSGGEALSTVSLGGDDLEVTVANAWIEPGKAPLYVLVTSSDAMIWQFSGAVDRVAFVVANAAKRGGGEVPRVGVVGVAQERVHIVAKRDCLKRYTGRDAKKKDQIVALLPYLIGRGADLATAQHAVSTVSLPSGLFDATPAYANAVELPESGPGAALWREMLRFNPGGLARVEAEAVVARVAAKDYAVLPQEAGLARLLEEGALELVGKSQVLILNGTEIVLGDGRDTIILPEGVQPEITMRPTKFKITRKIRYPAGLNGSHSVRFVLPAGVPEPDGSPGHSKVERLAE